MIAIIVLHTMNNQKSVMKNLDLVGTEINIKSPAVTLCTNKFNIQKSYALPTQCAFVL
jgi:hypothetical protein